MSSSATGRCASASPSARVRGAGRARCVLRASGVVVCPSHREGYGVARARRWRTDGRSSRARSAVCSTRSRTASRALLVPPRDPIASASCARDAARRCRTLGERLGAAARERRTRALSWRIAAERTIACLPRRACAASARLARVYARLRWSASSAWAYPLVFAVRSFLGLVYFVRALDDLGEQASANASCELRRS